MHCAEVESYMQRAGHVAAVSKYGINAVKQAGLQVAIRDHVLPDKMNSKYSNIYDCLWYIDLVKICMASTDDLARHRHLVDAALNHLYRHGYQEAELRDISRVCLDMAAAWDEHGTFRSQILLRLILRLSGNQFPEIRRRVRDYLSATHPAPLRIAAVDSALWILHPDREGIGIMLRMSDDDKLLAIGSMLSQLDMHEIAINASCSQKPDSTL